MYGIPCSRYLARDGNQTILTRWIPEKYHHFLAVIYSPGADALILQYFVPEFGTEDKLAHLQLSVSSSPPLCGVGCDVCPSHSHGASPVLGKPGCSWEPSWSSPPGPGLCSLIQHFSDIAIWQQPAETPRSLLLVSIQGMTGAGERCPGLEGL